MKQKILFLRNAQLFQSEEAALEKLNQISHLKGQPVVAVYGTSDEDAKLILAIGKKDGIGENCYELITTSADFSELTNIVGELSTTVSEHVNSKANGVFGHVKSGGDLTFASGIGSVNENAITYSKLQKIVGEQKVLGSMTPNGVVSELGKDELLTILGDILASQFKESKTIKLTGDVTGSVSSDFSGTITINTTVTDDSHNHVIDNVDGLQSALDLKAPLDSPNFTGTPLAPTAAAGTNTTQIATTAFVIKEVNDKISAANAMKFKGTIGSGGTIESLPTSYKQGDTYIAIEGCPNINGKAVEPGDMIVCNKTSTSASDENWTVIQANIDGAVTGPSSSIDGNLAIYSGASGKIIKDSSISASSLVQNTRTVSAGSGLTGGGSLNDNVTISHGNKPSSGSDAGGTGTFVTGVTIDSFGHISKTTKGDINISSGEVESGKYISGISVSGTDITVTKATLPAESGKVKVDSEDTSGYLIEKIVSGVSSGNSYAVTVSDSGSNLSLTCTVDVIDGGEY